MDRSFEVFNADGTKNGKVTRFAPLEVEIDGHKEQIDAAVTDLNGMDMFLEYDWLVKHKPEVDWNKETIKFTRCPKTCKINHQDISFTSNRRTQAMEKDKEQQKIGKEPDPTNPEDFPDYIRPFTHLFNKKKFEKLLVVATTCWNGTCSMLTSAKLTEGYLVVGITRELNKEPSLYCSSIYIIYK